MDDSWREKPEGCPGRFSLKTATCKECWRKTECTEELHAEMIEMARDSLEAMKAEKEGLKGTEDAVRNRFVGYATVPAPKTKHLWESIKEFQDVIAAIKSSMGKDVDYHILMEMVKAFVSFRIETMYIR